MKFALIHEGTVALALSAMLATQPMLAQQPMTSPAAVAASQPAPDQKPATLAKGVSVDLTLLDPVSSQTAVKGQLVHFAVSEDVLADGVVVIPRGTPATGVVSQVRKGIPGQHNGSIRLQPTQAVLANGMELKLRRNPPGEDDCANVGPCWMLATLAVVFSPVIVPLSLIASPKSVAHVLAEKKRMPPEGKDESLNICHTEFAYTASPVTAADPQEQSDSGEMQQELAQLESCAAAKEGKSGEEKASPQQAAP